MLGDGDATLIAIYARVSTSEQDCSVQIAELRQYAAARNWIIGEEYIDAGVSGKRASRPALDRLMRDALARRVSTILVVKLDRWGRSVLHLSQSIQQLRAASVRLIVTSQGIDTDEDNPASMLLLHILAAIAEFERGLIHERVMAGLHRARQHGTKSGRPAGRPRKIINRQAVWDRRIAGASYSALQREFGLSRGGAQRIVAAMPRDTQKMSL